MLKMTNKILAKREYLATGLNDNKIWQERSLTPVLTFVLSALSKLLTPAWARGKRPENEVFYWKVQLCGIGDKREMMTNHNAVARNPAAKLYNLTFRFNSAK